MKNRRARLGLKLIGAAVAIIVVQFLFTVFDVNRGMGGYVAFLKGEMSEEEIKAQIEKEIPKAMNRSFYITAVTWPLCVILGLTGFAFVVSGVFWAERQGQQAVGPYSPEDGRKGHR